MAYWVYLYPINHLHAERPAMLERELESLGWKHVGEAPGPKGTRRRYQRGEQRELLRHSR